MKVNFYRLILLLICLNFSSLFAQETPKQAAIPTKQQTKLDSTVFDSTKLAQTEAKTEPNQNMSSDGNITIGNLIALGVGLILLAGLFFNIYVRRKSVRHAQEIEQVKLEVKEEYEKKLEQQRLERLKNEERAKREVADERAQIKQQQKTKTAEQRYRDVLEDKLGSIKILGSHEIETVPVNLLDAFVSVDLSETLHSESRFDPKKMKQPSVQEKHTNPENVLKRAFKNYRLLLLIGDPGSGKTTLMKYYAISCLQDQEYKKFGFKERVLPLYFPLRELEPNDATPDSLPENLTRWAKNHALIISAEEFYNWLHERPTLVLLDGLDEISDLEQRKRVCKWIDNTCAGLKKARFVVTSRWTGYRKVDGIELGFDHMRADVRDFSKEQQEDFLTKWFRAVFQRNYTEEGEPSQEWLERQVELADKKVETIVSFIDKNKSLRSLSAVPMLLQIMAILWQERDILPQSRSELYNASLNYLLDFRDKRRQLLPVLDADRARRVLSPIALWMQGTLTKDEAPKLEMHEQMQPILNTLEKQPSAEDFCKNLIDRAGLLADYGETDYIFRHKSFREYLAGVQITKEDKKQEWLKRLVSHFGDDWWEEPLRFFISEADAEMFDSFMANLFKSEVSEDMDQKQQNLLQTLVREAPQKKIDALTKKLLDTKTTTNQQRYILECLKTMNTPEALTGVQEFKGKGGKEDANIIFADQIIYGRSGLPRTGVPKSFDVFDSLAPTLRNPYEDGAEYVLIPAGEFNYSVSGKKEPVANIHFARHPVTNKRYRRFIAYLDNQLKDLRRILPQNLFVEKLLEFAGTKTGFEGYLGSDDGGWANKLRSEEDENKRFNQDDQPVVSISWFAARAYCFWLSCIHEMQDGNRKLQNLDKIAEIYRLPTEFKWEWAAAGREPDGSLREYPWPKEKGEPNEKLANYGSHVDATTPVGRYPDGATPEGLMDMAGNVFEWMENVYQEDENWRALRGGSWYSDAANLRCSERYFFNPDDTYVYIGFRVVRPQSKI